MPAGFNIPPRNTPPMIGRNGKGGGFGSSSCLNLGQLNTMEGQLDPLDITNNYTSNSNLIRLRDDDFDSATKSGSDNHEVFSGDEQEPPPKKKRYHRHTQLQIQRLEAFFRECPHPDDKQRKELSRELNLEPLQIKFWFQNKRTQMKTQYERHGNTLLRTENDKLRADNMRYREALSNASCPQCGGPTAIGEMSFDEHHLRLENSRLRDEISRMSAIAAKYVGKPVMNFPLSSPRVQSHHLEQNIGNFEGQPLISSEMYLYGDMIRSSGAPTEEEKSIIIDIAIGAMEELIRIAQVGEPLWISGLDDSSDLLNEEEYLRTFSRVIGPKPSGFKTEASRETALVMINHLSLVEILMDVNQWSTVFTGIVSRAATLEVLATGVAGNYDGALQVMTSEYHIPSPLVPTRENYYARYCKQHGEGIWVVVDVSLDHLRPTSLKRCRIRPSGRLIQEMPNGYSKVTWVEHVEVDDRGVHSLYKHVNPSHAFGAKRWLATLNRQCERLSTASTRGIQNGDFGSFTNQEGRKSMLRLAERMVISFCSGVSASTAHTWTTLSGTGPDDVRVMSRKCVDDPGRPPGIVLSAATSFWIPVPPKMVFDFLRDKNSRTEWDILSNGGVLEEVANITTGGDTGNSVSLLRVKHQSQNSSQSNMLILQESLTDPTASFVIYAPVDVVAMNGALNGGDPDYVALLPSGFAVLPDGTGSDGGNLNGGGAGGTLLSVAFQILVDSVPTAKLSLESVATVNNLIACTVERIKASLSTGCA